MGNCGFLFNASVLSNTSQLMSFLLCFELVLISDKASSQEECQEGNPVLSDGLRCQRNRYVMPALFPYLPNGMLLTIYFFYFALGRTTFVNTLCGQQVLESKDADDAANAHIEEGVRIKPVTVGKISVSTRPLSPWC